jgi:hypothetical protein
MPADSERLGEIIEASTTTFTAESAKLNEPPGFGTFVRVPPANVPSRQEDPFEDSPPPGTIYGITIRAQTASREPNRRAASFGLDEKDLEREQPQLWELLATDFTCLILAHSASGVIHLFLPSAPPRLHASVQPCSESEVCAITEGFAYLRTIASSPECPNCDELLAATLREAHRCHGKDAEFLIRAGRHLAHLLGDDYERLAAILRKLQFQML